MYILLVYLVNQYKNSNQHQEDSNNNNKHSSNVKDDYQIKSMDSSSSSSSINNNNATVTKDTVTNTVTSTHSFSPIVTSHSTNTISLDDGGLNLESVDNVSSPSSSSSSPWSFQSIMSMMSMRSASSDLLLHLCSIVVSLVSNCDDHDDDGGGGCDCNYIDAFLFSHLFIIHLISIFYSTSLLYYICR